MALTFSIYLFFIEDALRMKKQESLTGGMFHICGRSVGFAIFAI